MAKQLTLAGVKIPRSVPEEKLAWQLKNVAPNTVFERQFKICESRKFSADFFFPRERLVVEVDGGAWVQGRHSRGSGVESDAEKSALIAAMPARLIRVTPKQIRAGLALQWILKALNISPAYGYHPAGAIRNALD